jgi:hypothetical protein
MKKRKETKVILLSICNFEKQKKNNCGGLAHDADADAGAKRFAIITVDSRYGYSALRSMVINGKKEKTRTLPPVPSPPNLVYMHCEFLSVWKYGAIDKGRVTQAQRNYYLLSKKYPGMNNSNHPMLWYPLLVSSPTGRRTYKRGGSCQRNLRL